MKKKNLIKVVLLTVVFLLVTVAIIYPQPPPPPPGPDPPGGDGAGGSGIPLQGNLYFLLAAGIAYIAKTGFNIKLRKLFSKKTVA